MRTLNFLFCAAIAKRQRQMVRNYQKELILPTFSIWLHMQERRRALTQVGERGEVRSVLIT
jgi:hypothetical protein